MLTVNELDRVKQKMNCIALFSSSFFFFFFFFWGGGGCYRTDLGNCTYKCDETQGSNNKRALPTKIVFVVVVVADACA